MVESGPERERLASYVEMWWGAVNDFTRLLEKLGPDDWAAPTDLPGWDVHAVAAHVAHLEAVLAGAAQDAEEAVDPGAPSHVRNPMGAYCERGVLARRAHTPDELVNEIRAAATSRHTALLADPPSLADQPPARLFPGLAWTWEQLLRNRTLDVWMHDQDVRRAVGLPGGLDTPAAAHAADYLLLSLGMVVGKRVAPPVGTVVAVEVDGSPPLSAILAEGGRAGVHPGAPAGPDVTLRMTREAYVVLAGGRQPPEAVEVRVEGDADLARRVLAALAVTF